MIWGGPRAQNSRWVFFFPQQSSRAGGNIFICENGEYITSEAVCDGLLSCKTGEDETGCMDTCAMKDDNHIMYPTRCKKICVNMVRCHCSSLYWSDNRGNCRPFKEQSLSSYVAKIEFWHCKHDKRMIPVIQLNDIIPDCNGADDEPLLKSLLQNKGSIHFSPCSNHDQLPCFEGHPQCFNITDICVYRLDSSNNLYPCRTGVHLEVCENFTCNKKFKCPGYYCLPFGYLCDKKYDCPLGEDEGICDEMQGCKNMYKCRGTKQCIHLSDVCDDHVDCKYGEDEKQCQLHGVKCPDGCTCLMYHLATGKKINSHYWDCFKGYEELIIKEVVWNGALTRRTM